LNRRRKKDDAPAGAPAWMMTYGDLVTQMLTFFILLFTFSTLDVIKFRDAVISLQGAFGVLSGGAQILNLSDMPTTQPTRVETAPKVQPTLIKVKSTLDEMIKVEEMIQQVEHEYLHPEGADKKQEHELDETESLITTIIDERGLRIRFTDPLLFDLGRADLRSESVGLLRNVSDVLAALPNFIEVEGHTDNIPIRTSIYKSNWDLSAARSCEVLRFLIQEGGIEPTRLAAAGYGEYKPIALNDTPDNRRKNRRVEILVLNEEETLRRTSR